MKFNEKLKSLRVQKGYTQEYVASRLNVARQSVSKWESGINEPDINTLKKLCVIFDISINDLIDDDKDVVVSQEERKIKINKILYLVMIAILLYATLSLIVFMPYLPKQVIGNINLNGNVTYNSKWVFVLSFGLSNLIPLGTFYLYTRYEQKYTIYRQNMLIKTISLLIVQVLLLILELVLCFISVSDFFTVVNKLMTALTANLIIVLACFSNPLINKKPKYTFGFLTSFTLTNKDAWYKVNMLQSILMFSTALILLIVSFMVRNDQIMYYIPVIIIAFIPTLIYHEWLRKKENSIQNKKLN